MAIGKHFGRHARHGFRRLGKAKTWSGIGKAAQRVGHFSSQVSPLLVSGSLAVGQPEFAAAFAGMGAAGKALERGGKFTHQTAEGLRVPADGKKGGYNEKHLLHAVTHGRRVVREMKKDMKEGKDFEKAGERAEIMAGGGMPTSVRHAGILQHGTERKMARTARSTEMSTKKRFEMLQKGGVKSAVSQTDRMEQGGRDEAF